MTLHPLANGDNPCETEGGSSYKQQIQEYPTMNEHAHWKALQTTWHMCNI